MGNITNEQLPYNINELRSNAKKRKEDIGECIKNNPININNWNNITDKY